MSTHEKDKRAVPTYSDARPVGQHLVVDKVDWVPGFNPETSLREDGTVGYTERYLRCVRCGKERLSQGRFPEECPG